jgi:hypothetical protein
MLGTLALAEKTDVGNDEHQNEDSSQPMLGS